MPISEILDGVWAEGTAVMNHSNATTNVHGAGVNSLEHTGNKNIANGYAGLDPSGLIPSTLGAELLANKDEVNGYAGLDSSGHVPVADLFYYTLLQAVSVVSNIPYIDDAPTYSNLVFCPTHHHILFSETEQNFYFEKEPTFGVP